MWCCGLIPLGLFLFAGPMLAGGRGGLRPYLISLTAGWGLLMLLAIANGPGTLELLRDWRGNAPLLVGLTGLFVASVTLGGIVVYARAAEERSPDRGRCRRCGYDLRASPDRCPECGEPVKPGRERV